MHVYQVDGLSKVNTMTNLKLRNLKVSKVQKTETETESGITEKWTYEFQDEDKEFKITLKTEHKNDFMLDETVDIRFGNDQTTLGAHVDSEDSKDSEDDEPPYDTDKQCAKCKQYWDREADMVSDDLCKDCAKIEEPDTIPENVKEKADKELEKDKKKKKGPKRPDSEKNCKFYYKGGLCANSQMTKPFCQGIETCEYYGNDTEETTEEGLPGKQGYAVKGIWKIKHVDTPDEKGWDEESQTEEGLSFAEQIQKFNDTMRPGEIARELIGAIEEDYIKVHRWSGKLNSVTQMDKTGQYDEYECQDCGKKYKRRTLDWNPPRDDCKPKGTKKKSEKKEDCKFYYRGGLCANSKMEKPFCVGLDKCPEIAQQELPVEPEPKKKKGSPGTPSKEKESSPAPDAPENPHSQMFLGVTYEYQTTKKGEPVTREVGIVECDDMYGAMWISKKGGFHKIRSKDLMMHKTRDAAQRELNTWAANKSLETIRDNSEDEEETSWVPAIPVGNILVKKEIFPDILGGLETDIIVEKTENGDQFLYAHAKSQFSPGSTDEDEVIIGMFETKLEELTGMKWKQTTDRTYNCDKDQLNKIEEA